MDEGRNPVRHLMLAPVIFIVSFLYLLYAFKATKPASEHWKSKNAAIILSLCLTGLITWLLITFVR